jgi:hypothetical protein
MITYNDLCPGYRREHYAAGGRCCCGLHWEGKMPMHTEHGVTVPDEMVARLDARVRGADEDALRRAALRTEQRRTRTLRFGR